MTRRTSQRFRLRGNDEEERDRHAVIPQGSAVPQFVIPAHAEIHGDGASVGTRNGNDTASVDSGLPPD